MIQPYCLLRKMVKYLFIEPFRHRSVTLECKLNVLEPMIPGLSKGVLPMFFSKLDQQKLGSKWELGGHYSSRSKCSDVTTMCNRDLVNFGINFDVRKCSIEEDIVLMTNANVTAETDSESMDAVDGSVPVPEEEEPEQAAADITTTESQLSDMEVAGDPMILEDDCMPDAANIVVSISSEVSSTPQEVPDGLPDTFLASAPLGSMWIPDLHYPMVALVCHSCQMAGWPWPNYCV